MALKDRLIYKVECCKKNALSIFRARCNVSENFTLFSQLKPLQVKDHLPHASHLKAAVKSLLNTTEIMQRILNSILKDGSLVCSQVAT